MASMQMLTSYIISPRHSTGEGGSKVGYFGLMTDDCIPQRKEKGRAGSGGSAEVVDRVSNRLRLSLHLLRHSSRFFCR